MTFNICHLVQFYVQSLLQKAQNLQTLNIYVDNNSLKCIQIKSSLTILTSVLNYLRLQLLLTDGGNGARVRTIVIYNQNIDWDLDWCNCNCVVYPHPPPSRRSVSGQLIASSRSSCHTFWSKYKNIRHPPPVRPSTDS